MLHRIILLSGLLSLSGCASIAKYLPPEPSAAAVATDLTAENAAAYRAGEPLRQWWQGLGDPLLAQLIEAALKENLQVDIARANILEARAALEERRFDRYPTVTATASAERQRLSQETASGEFLRDNTFNQFQYGFDARWEMDLYGRVSQRIVANQALYAATVYGLDDLYVSLAAEVARLYINLRGAQSRLAIAEQNAANQTETFALTNTLAEGGRATALDTSRADAQLNTTLASIPPLKAEVTASINSLSVLTGNVPDHLRQRLTESQPLPSIPAAIAVGDVSGLIQRRPDIRRAERLIAARTAEYNVAASDLMPTVTISGFFGFVASTLSSLASGGAVNAVIGPTLNWRAFDLGRVRAQVAQSDARTEQALASYENTVLQALAEIQTALTQYTHEQQRRAYLQQAAVAIREAAALARERYRLGVDTFIDVLDAERSQLETEDALAVSEIRLATDLIAIYKALGGGWRYHEED